MAQIKSHFDEVLDKMKADPTFYEKLCKNPSEALKNTGIEFTEGEQAVISLIDKNLINLKPQELQKRETAKGGGRHKGGS